MNDHRRLAGGLAAGLFLLILCAPLPFGGRTPIAAGLLSAAAALLAAGALAVQIRTPGERPESPPAAIPLLLFLLLAACQLVPLPVGLLSAIDPAALVLRERVWPGAWKTVPLSLSPAATASAVGRLGAVLSVFAAAVVVARRRGGAALIATSLCASGCLQALYGLADELSGRRSIFGYARHDWIGRLAGTYINPNHFAGLVELALPAALGLAFSLGFGPAAARRLPLRVRLAEALTSPTLGRRRLLGAGVGLMALALLLSRSRAGVLLAGLAAAATIAFGRPRPAAARRTDEAPPAARDAAGTRRLAWVGGCAVLAILAAGPIGLDGLRHLSGTYASASTDLFAPGGRLQVYRDTMGIVRDHPAFGVGLGGFASAFPRYRSAGVVNRWEETHNDYLQAVAETGVLGAALIAWGGLSLALTLRRRTPRQDAPTRAVRIGLSAGCAAFLTHELVDFNGQIPANAFAFAAALAGAVCNGSGDARGPRPVRPRGAGRFSLAALFSGAAIAAAVWGAWHPGNASAQAVARGRSLAASMDRSLAESGGRTADSSNLALAARAELEAAVRGDPASAESQVLLARLDRLAAATGLPGAPEDGMPRPAYDLRLRRAAELDPHRPDLRLALLRERVAAGDAGGACTELTAIAARGEDGVWDALVSLWNLEPDPLFVDGCLPAGATRDRARLVFTDFLRTLGKNEEAESRLRAIVQGRGPLACRAFEAWAGLVVSAGRATEAASAGVAILRDRGSDRSCEAAVLPFLARALVAAGRGEDAIGRVRQALALDAQDPVIRLAAGEVFLACGLPQEARDQFERLLEGGAPPQFLAARERTVRVGLARACEALNQRDGALRQWREVVRLDPSDEEARRRIVALELGF